jgi:DNA-binding NarL/FixJ family response regulator
MPIRVLVADDHSIIREGLKMLVAKHPQIEIVGEAINGQEAVDLTEDLLPDVVVMDITMPLLDGPAATAQIIARHPQVKVIALSMHTEEYFVDKMKAAGATGYIAKEQAWEELVEAVEAVATGGSYFPNR